MNNASHIHISHSEGMDAWISVQSLTKYSKQLPAFSEYRVILKCRSATFLCFCYFYFYFCCCNVVRFLYCFWFCILCILVISILCLLHLTMVFDNHLTDQWLR